MLRTVLGLSAAALAVSPVLAATYSAKLAAPTSERFIARDITWKCGPDACQGATDESRPVVVEASANEVWTRPVRSLTAAVRLSV